MTRALSIIHDETPDLIRDFERIGVDWYDLYYEESQLAHHSKATLLPFNAFANNLSTVYLSETAGMPKNKRFQYDAPDIYNTLVLHRMTFELDGLPHIVPKGGGFTCATLPSLASQTTTHETSSDS